MFVTEVLRFGAAAFFALRGVVCLLETLVMMVMCFLEDWNQIFMTKQEENQFHTYAVTCVAFLSKAALQLHPTVLITAANKNVI